MITRERKMELNLKHRGLFYLERKKIYLRCLSNRSLIKMKRPKKKDIKVKESLMAMEMP
jgi:hypothetical protein